MSAPKWISIGLAVGVSGVECRNWYYGIRKPFPRNAAKAAKVRQIISLEGEPPKRLSMPCWNRPRQAAFCIIKP
jgi:hypothetical protein